MLSELQLAEFIYEQPAAGDIEYTFKHALTQDVAYNSMLIERRKALHERRRPRLKHYSRDGSTITFPIWRIITAAAETPQGD